jgi:hypothetical protein
VISLDDIDDVIGIQDLEGLVHQIEANSLGYVDDYDNMIFERTEVAHGKNSEPDKLGTPI